MMRWSTSDVYSVMRSYDHSSNSSTPSIPGLSTRHAVVVADQAGGQVEVVVAAVGVEAEVEPRTKCRSLMRTLYDLRSDHVLFTLSLSLSLSLSFRP